MLANYEEAQEIVQERRKEYESAERSVQTLERELEALGTAAEDVETLLAQARARRDAQWNVVAGYLEQGKILALEEAIFLNAIRAFKRGVDETDALHEKRRESAEKKGYVDKLRRDLSAATQERDAIRTRLDASVERAAKIERETKFFFAQGGFEFCAAWSMDALLAWIGEWRALAGLLDELSEIEKDVKAFALELRDFLAHCVQIAVDWGADLDLDFDARAPLPLDAPDESLETLLASFAAAARRWKLLEADAKRRQERVVEYARCVDERRRVEVELREVEAELDALAAERAALAADLADFLNKIDPPVSVEARRSWNALLLFFQGLKRWREAARSLEKDAADFDAKRSRFDTSAPSRRRSALPTFPTGTIRRSSTGGRRSRRARATRRTRTENARRRRSKTRFFSRTSRRRSTRFATHTRRFGRVTSRKKRSSRSFGNWRGSIARLAKSVRPRGGSLRKR